MKHVLLAVFCFFTLPSHAEESNYFGLPIFLKYEGVGGILGLAGGARNIAGPGSQLLAGGAFGAGTGGGIYLKSAPLSENFKLSAVLGYVRELHLATVYTRGYNHSEDLTYVQKLGGAGGGISLEQSSPDGLVKLNYGIAYSQVKLIDYQFDGETIERPNQANYHDVDTLALSLGAVLDLTKGDGLEKNGVQLALNATTASLRAGQSDTLTLTPSIVGYWPLREGLQLASYLRFSDAHVTRRQENYTDPTAVKNAFDTKCSTASSSAAAAECEKFETTLANYVAKNNEYGLAVPLGGSNGLRAFDEFSIRAAHTRLATFELRWDATPGLLRNSATTLQLAPFLDIGFAADDSSEIYRESRNSTGLSMRLLNKDSLLRLTTAWAPKEYAWFFALGQAY